MTIIGGLNNNPREAAVKMIRTLSAVSLVAFLSACVTYRDFPADMVNNPPKAKTFGTLYYKINPAPILSMGDGGQALETVFKQKTPFATTKRADKVPAQGIYVEVETLYKAPTVPAAVFGYFSVSTLTALPFWSNRDGYRMNYHVYVNGEKKESYEYEITRKGAVWVALLPFIWLNAFTYSEAEAFEATAYQFFKDSGPLFVANRK
jgi:hypothetical protein